MSRLSQASEERDDLLREIQDDLDSDLGLDDVEETTTRTEAKSSGKLTPVNFAAYALGAAAVLWIALKILPTVWAIAKFGLIIGVIGWIVLWWLGRKSR